jgi:hypothetical protein
MAMAPSPGHGIWYLFRRDGGHLDLIHVELITGNLFRCGTIGASTPKALSSMLGSRNSIPTSSSLGFLRDSTVSGRGRWRAA